MRHQRHKCKKHSIEELETILRQMREEENSAHKADVILEGWVARDRLKDGLFLHYEEPFRAHSGYQTDGLEDEWRNDGVVPYPLPTSSFPDLKWKDEPRKVRIKIEEI